MQLGIVGLPFSGKSTLFQAITRTHLDSAAMAKREAHVAIVRVPDERLDRCSAIFSPKSTVHATIEFVDVPGLKKAASGTTQFTTGFLSAVKTNDALIQAVRLFANDAVPHPDGSIDPLRDVATFETEFILADMAVLESRLEKINKQIARWSVQSPPDDWTLIRARWVRFHIVRTLFSLPALACYILSITFSGTVSS